MDYPYLGLTLLIVLLLPGVAMSADVHGVRVILTNNTRNVYIHDLGSPIPTVEAIEVREQNQLVHINITLNSQLTLELKLRVRNGVDRYKEVPHPHDDNQFVLQSHPRSDIYHLRYPMSYIIDNYCTRPLPKQYYIIKDTYKDRPTMAYPYSCTYESMRNASGCRYVGQKIYRRSVNDQCIWHHNGKMEHQDEEVEQLPYNLNSIFCVDDSQLLRDKFQEQVKDDGDSYLLLRPECEMARARCADCEIIRCKSKRSCCSTSAKCLLSQHCLKVYSSDCDKYSEEEYNDPVCIRGNTFKLTLTPEFDFDKKHFFCHIRREKFPVNISGRITLHGPWGNSIPSMVVKVDELLRSSDTSLLENLNAKFVSSSLGTLEDVVFERRGYEFFLHNLKKPEQFQLVISNVYSHFSKTYIKVQFATPFLFTTETWSKETCQVNTSHIVSAQPIYDQNSTTRIRLLYKPIKGSDSHGLPGFDYALLPEDVRSAKIRLRFTDKSSTLRPFLCNRTDVGWPTNIVIELELGSPNSWILHIRGEFRGTFTYFTVSVLDTLLQGPPIFHSDIVATNASHIPSQSQTFSLSVTISISESRTHLNQFQVIIDHCQTMLLQRSMFLKTNKHSILKTNEKDIEPPKDISNFLLTFFLSVLSVCFLYFMMLAFQALRRSSKALHFKTPTNQPKKKKRLNYISIIKAIIFLILKLFYSVTFTLSLVLSVCLSLNGALMLSNMSTKSGALGNTRNHSSEKDVRNLSCSALEDIDPRTLIQGVRKVLLNNDFVRIKSRQSIPSSVLSMVDENPIKKTETFLSKVINSMYLVIDGNLKRRVGEYVRIYDQIKGTKWLSLPRAWNSSVTTVAFPSDFKEDYLGSFNLLNIYAGTAALENCVIFDKRLHRWKPSSIGKHVQLINNLTQYLPSPHLPQQRGRHHRLFLSHNLSAATIPRNRSDSVKSVANDSVSSLELIKIRLVFMLIDTVLILYRLYWTYSDMQQMWRSRKEVIHFNKMTLKGSEMVYSDQTKSSTVQWSKQHHLECLISGHLIVAAIIILASIICTNLIVLLTSKEHASWLSRKTGHITRVRSLKMLKERLSQINIGNIVPVQRHWEHLRMAKIKELMTHRMLSSNKMLNLELFFNKYYFYELCHFQKFLMPSVKSIDFCSSIMPREKIVPNQMCESLSNSPQLLYYDLSGYTPSRTINYVNGYIHFSVHVLAILILVAAIVGISKIVRKQIRKSILSSNHTTYIIHVNHEQYYNYFRDNLKRKVPLHFSSIYNAGLEPHQHYQCIANKPKQNTAF